MKWVPHQFTTSLFFCHQQTLGYSLSRHSSEFHSCQQSSLLGLFISLEVFLSYQMQIGVFVHQQPWTEVQKLPFSRQKCRLVGKLRLFQLKSAVQNKTHFPFRITFPHLRKKRTVLLWCAETANVLGGNLGELLSSFPTGKRSRRNLKKRW